MMEEKESTDLGISPEIDERIKELQEVGANEYLKRVGQRMQERLDERHRYLQGQKEQRRKRRKKIILIPLRQAKKIIIRPRIIILRRIR